MINYSHKFAMKLNNEMLPYEAKFNLKLDEDKYYVIRFDGVKMTKHFLGKEEARVPFFKTMKQTLADFMLENPNLKFAYSYADEISVFLSKEALEEYEYRIEKILSVYSSQLGFIFSVNAVKNNLELDDKIRCFDCRIIELEDLKKVRDYFASRQAFQISSHFLRLKYQYLPDFVRTNTNDIYNELMKKGIYYDKLTKAERYGILWVEDCFQIVYEFLADLNKLYKQLQLDSKYVYMKKLEKRKKYV